MSDNKGFEPYIDWNAVSQEMADDLHTRVVAYHKAIQKFEKFNTPQNAAAVLKLQYELSNISNAIHGALVTIPVMVHKAGEKISGIDPEGHNSVTQNCVRCGSILQLWCEAYVALTPNGPQQVQEEDLPWWEPGDVVAKATDEDSMTMYEIKDDRALEKHERECVDLSGLDLPSED